MLPHCAKCHWQEQVNQSGFCSDCWCTEHESFHLVTCGVCGNERPNMDRHGEVEVCKDCDIAEANLYGPYRSNKQRTVTI